jgi:hypothetical protein
MTRLIAAALLLCLAALPAVACEWNRAASTESRQNTAASQPTDDHAAPPPPAAATDQTPS